MTPDDAQRIRVCLRVIVERNERICSILVGGCGSALAGMLKEEADYVATQAKARKKKAVAVEADDPISFLQLVSKSDMVNGEDVLERSLSEAVGLDSKKDSLDFSSSKLSKVTQLTGFSDPVYAEAYINVNQFDIVLDVLIVNQTSELDAFYDQTLSGK
jgi:coatomer subunit beta